MNRRDFGKESAITLALLSLGLTGCPSTTTIAQFVSIIGKDAADLASLLNQPALANQILSLSSQIAVDITNWQSGDTTSVQKAIQAIQALMSLIGTLPITVPYAPLIDLLLSALSGLLLLLPGASGAIVPHTVGGRPVLPFHYPDASQKSMSKARKDFERDWKALNAGVAKP